MTLDPIFCFKMGLPWRESNVPQPCSRARPCVLQDGKFANRQVRFRFFVFVFFVVVVVGGGGGGPLVV
jgi:hypothetical protein